MTKASIIQLNVISVNSRDELQKALMKYIDEIQSDNLYISDLRFSTAYNGTDVRYSVIVVVKEI